MPHHYRIVLQEVTADSMPTERPPLSFPVSNHDDLFEILEKMKTLHAVPEREVAEFAIGLKLFTETLIRHRKEPLFAELWPHIGAFMKRLKDARPEV